MNSLSITVIMNSFRIFTFVTKKCWHMHIFDLWPHVTSKLSMTERKKSCSPLVYVFSLQQYKIHSDFQKKKFLTPKLWVITLSHWDKPRCTNIRPKCMILCAKLYYNGGSQFFQDQVGGYSSFFSRENHYCIPSTP